MDKRKAIVCTSLFVVVLMSAFIGSFFVKNADGTLVLFDLFAWIITARWIADSIAKFYKWLMK
jgi:hypothetical protein